jgi:hypothetical protein
MSTWGGSHTRTCSVQAHVRFGSLADICSAKGMSALPPIATAKADMPQTVMSALAPKADMCSARGHVCFGPIADIGARLNSKRTPFARAVSTAHF